MGEAAYKLPENTPPNTPPQLAMTVWRKGDPSPNPGGRPKGLAAYIRENSLDGRELADFLLKAMRGEYGFKGPDRIRACELLLNRGFGSQPTIEPDKNLKPILDLDKLDPKELEFLENVRLGLVAIRERITRGETTPEVQ